MSWPSDNDEGLGNLEEEAERLDMDMLKEELERLKEAYEASEAGSEVEA